ncbi:MAG: hypothetical protein HYS80_01360 [Candidatus Aenigmarchaeota archaeon]|nr:hypothetical protein [Candidatus Aenigmarchaeota archaeon]
MKAYIAAPYTSKSVTSGDPHYGEINDNSYINFLESIESVVRSFGFQTFLPHRDLHKWGKSNLKLEEVGQTSMKELKNSDLLIAYPEQSVGVNIELGWASAFKKKILILLNENNKVSIMHEGLSGVTDSKIIKFTSIMDLRTKLREELNRLKE